MFFVDEHLSGGPNPTRVVRHAQVERVTQIVVRPPASLLGGPRASPAQNFARHVSVEFPILLFLFFVVDWDIELTAYIVRRMHIGLVHRPWIFVVPVLGYMDRRLNRANEI